eukprot:g29506.t1
MKRKPVSSVKQPTTPNMTGRTGRYTLKEKWKDIERHFTPDEKLLPSLRAREWLGLFGKSKEGKVKGKDPGPEKKASNSDQHLGEELNQLLQHQQQKLTSIQAELEASEMEIAKLQEDNEPNTHEEIIRLQELIGERSTEAEEVEFWENELKAEQLHGAELREQLEEMKEKLEECEEKLRDCLLKAQDLEADLEIVRSQREWQEAKSCHDIRIKVEELKEEITVKSQEAVRLEQDVRLVEKVIDRVENEIQ